MCLVGVCVCVVLVCLCLAAWRWFGWLGCGCYLAMVCYGSIILALAWGGRVVCVVARLWVSAGIATVADGVIFWGPSDWDDIGLCCGILGVNPWLGGGQLHALGFSHSLVILPAYVFFVWMREPLTMNAPPTLNHYLIMNITAGYMIVDSIGFAIHCVRARR